MSLTAGTGIERCLARRAAHGEFDALEEFVRRHQDWVHTIALRLLGDSADAADLTEEALIRLVTRIGESVWAAEDEPPDVAVLREETRLRCLTGMLLCLEAEQRIAYVLCELLELPSTDAARILVFEQCGLVRPENPCRCARKTRRLVERGLIDPERLVFTRQRTEHQGPPQAPRDW